MKIKVLRDYSGAEGTDVDKNVHAGSTHTVTRARGAELQAVGLVEIIDDGDDESADDATGAPAVEEKSEIKPIANKPAKTPANKAAPKAADKSKGE